MHFFNRRKMDGNCFEGFHIWPQTKIWDRKKMTVIFFSQLSSFIIFVCFFYQILRKRTCLKFLSKRKTIVFFWSDSTRLIEINVWWSTPPNFPLPTTSLSNYTHVITHIRISCKLYRSILMTLLYIMGANNFKKRNFFFIQINF